MGGAGYVPIDIEGVLRIFRERDLPPDTKVETHSITMDGIQTVADLLLFSNWPKGLALIVGSDADFGFCLATIEPA